MKEGLVKKFLKFSYGSWVGLTLGILTTMITTRLLPPDAFGKASMFELFLQVGMILTIFGTDQSFVRFFYEEETNKRGALLYNSLKIPAFTTLIMLTCIFVFYKPITHFLISRADLKFAILLVVGILAQLLLRYGLLVIRMQQKGNLYSLLQIFQGMINLILIIIFFYLVGSTFEVLILSKVITLVIVVLIAIYFGRDLWALKNLTVKKVRHTQSEIFRFGAPFVLTIFISWLFESFDKIAIRHWNSFDELGLYASAMKLVSLVLVLKISFSTFWTPVAYEKFEKDSDDILFFRYITLIVSFIMYLVAIGSIAGKDLIVMLLGSEYKQAAAIMPFLVFMPTLYTISETTVVGINFYKKTKWHIFIAGIACIINIIGNWLLVPNYGAIGASLSTAFSYIIFFTLRTQISSKFFKVNYPLVKMYTMIIVISVYATFSIFSSVTWINLLSGIIPTLILVALYYKDLKYLYINRKSILQ